jgi:hypothetical protein
MGCQLLSVSHFNFDHSAIMRRSFNGTPALQRLGGDTIRSCVCYWPKVWRKSLACFDFVDQSYCRVIVETSFAHLLDEVSPAESVGFIWVFSVEGTMIELALCAGALDVIEEMPDNSCGVGFEIVHWLNYVPIEPVNLWKRASSRVRTSVCLIHQQFRRNWCISIWQKAFVAELDC